LDFVHPDDREATGAQLEALRGGAAITYFENRFASKGGGYRWLGWTAAPFAAEGLLYIFARDLTERRKAEEERVKLIREQTARALQPGQPAVLVADARERLPELAQDEAHRALLEKLGLRSLMVVPIVSRERTLGALSLLSSDSGRVFGRDDLDLAEELGRRAA